MFKGFHLQSKIADNALSLTAAALLALALAVGANSGILSLSALTPARESPLSRERYLAPGRYYEFIRRAVSDASPRSICDSNESQDRDDQSALGKECYRQSFDIPDFNIRLKTGLFNRRVPAGRF